MGMFDRIFFPCPNCGDLIEAQSKSGDCNGDEYDYRKVPKDVAEDANRHAPYGCKGCGNHYSLRERPPSELIEFEIV